ncbi:MAG: exodeoxyribonuclease VII small subunit [Ferruginibacter sp.]|nr:exodeoxyribonuclease VII small subunit [Ferruginibacter sp.]
MKPIMTFDKAFSELEKIVGQIEDENIQLDTLADKVKDANELIKYCETRLRAISEDIEKEKINNG